MNTIQFKQEKRFAVVMYGGVSLAIYMNGVAQELFNFVRSTSDEYDQKRPSGTWAAVTDVYRELAEDDDVKARFVIDVLSGTSAGGINAVYLAKALANNQDFEQLEQLWIEEGNIERLLYDKHSIKNTKGVKEKSDLRNPKSILNGYRMYEKLLDALDNMGPDTGESLVDELDLYLTMTDLQGRPAPIRLANETVIERNHRDVLHFSMNKDTNEFRKDNNYALAFAARATSSFPVAFEPARQCDLAPNKDSLRDPKRAFADGGYLDNKPFSYAIEALAERKASVPVDRKLLYIEPSPEFIDLEETIREPPDALTNAATAFTLARYETIMADLRLIHRRNRLIERVERILRGTDEDILKLNTTNQPLTVEKWLNRDLQEMIESEGIAYAGYLRLRVARLTDELTTILARHIGLDDIESDKFLVVRNLVRAWRDAHYAYYDCDSGEKPTPSGQKLCFNRFIIEFDFGFHLRRLSVVISKIDLILADNEDASRTLRQTKIGYKVSHSEEFRTELREIRSTLSEERMKIATLQVQLRNPSDEHAKHLRKKLDISRETLMDMLHIDSPEQAFTAAQSLVDSRREQISALMDDVRESVLEARQCMRRCKKRVDLKGTLSPVQMATLEAPNEIAAKARWFAAFWFRMFSYYDLITFPILQTPDLGEEIDEIQIIRISPSDPTRLGGARLGHFGAFFDRLWRKNDILRGRLDAAEQIIGSLLPGKTNEAKRQNYVERAHMAIFEDIAAKPNRRMDLLCDALKSGDPSDRRKVNQLTGVPLGGAATRGLNEVLEKAVTGMCKEDLRQRFADYRIDTRIDPAFAVRTTSRALSTAGKMLSGIANDHHLEAARPMAARIAAIGEVGTRLMEAALPQNMGGLLLRHWLRLLIFISIIILSGSVVLNNDELRQLGGILLVVSVVAQLTILAVRRASRMKRWSPLARLLVLLAAIPLAVGVIYLPEALQDLIAFLKGLFNNGG